MERWKQQPATCIRYFADEDIAPISSTRTIVADHKLNPAIQLLAAGMNHVHVEVVSGMDATCRIDADSFE